MEEVDVLIVGAGISGIGAACHLRRARLPHSFVILEGREALGGTWDLFRYPGIRSDSDMYTFGYSFKPWVHDSDIASGDAILGYLHETVEEYALAPHIRYQHRVVEARWSSSEGRWHVQVQRPGSEAPTTMACRFLLTCTGYYDYSKGHQPDFPGRERFQGTFVHPQFWPDDLDYAGKRVAVIGSGATAVTLVPALVDGGADVTMVQRSPSYIYSRAAEDPVANWLHRLTPPAVAHRALRAYNVFYQWYTFTLSQRRPEVMREYLLEQVANAVGPDVDVEVHFNPRYAPWDQRLCLTPNGEFFEVLRRGAAKIVTDSVDHLDEAGIVLASGERVDADIIVSATGLELQFLGGMTMAVDDRELEAANLVSYRGVMFAGVPNWVAFVGYAAASWTLKVDLTATWLCRVLKHMDKRGFSAVVPQLPPADMPTRPFLDRLRGAGYVARRVDELPRQGHRDPWVNGEHYVRDLSTLRFAPVRDRTLTYR